MIILHFGSPILEHFKPDSLPIVLFGSMAKNSPNPW